MIRHILFVFWKWLFRLFVIFFGLVALFFVAGFVLSSFPVNNGFAQTSPNAPDTIQLFVTSNGVHTDLVVPVVTPYIDWRTFLPVTHYPRADSSFTHLAFGWGNRRFYMETPEWSDLKLDVAISAALWPGASAMHVEYIPRPLKVNKYQRPVYVTPEQYRKLITYIKSSFRQQDGKVMLIPNASYTGHDRFYEAHGRFFGLKNCNNWVNQGLKAMGVKTAWWAPFPYAIMRHLR